MASKDAQMTMTDPGMVDDVLAAGSRRREVGLGSARSSLLTILGEFVYPRGTPVWTATLVAALGELNIEEKAARQAIARSAADGVLESTKSGRRVCWHITPPGTRLLREGTRRIYGFLTDTAVWDGNWFVLSVAIPETQRQLRHKLRTRLTWLGMGSPSPGIWILPDASRADEVAAVVDELALTGRAFGWTGKLAAVGDTATLLADAWSLDDVEQQYGEFIATFERAQAATPREAFQAQTRLVQAWRRFPFLDPALPRELLDHDWPGPPAAAVFHSRHSEWHTPAQQYWSELLETTSS
ncbi:phenylacetic acid degradation operon negative regulatory protein [Mycobacteroides abscessus subsp. bolletii]|nr:phenylacetic acid degradation operon negative regulatory protein [Mycobacteroides abscessus subsp. bolletii]SKH11424.1 phenylacetic acid degradation operon negative regulatory protein [Mycobacteroides abscessus subsp. bolletii]